MQSIVLVICVCSRMAGIGRGGRGLAMAEAMNSTLRQPGTAATTATDSVQVYISLC
jgi:hypothetical protein